jgi:hypothetical protein
VAGYVVRSVAAYTEANVISADLFDVAVVAISERTDIEVGVPF